MAQHDPRFAYYGVQSRAGGTRSERTVWINTYPDQRRRRNARRCLATAAARCRSYSSITHLNNRNGFLREFRAYSGNPYPLGATWDGSGVNFALFSENAERVDLCIFDQAYGAPEIARIRMREQTDNVWHVYLPEATARHDLRLPRLRPLRPGERPPLQPSQAAAGPLRKATTGTIEWSDAMFGYPVESDDEDRDLAVRRPRQRPRHAQVGRHRVRVYLGRRQTAAHAVVGHRDLRSARQGTDASAPGPGAERARHLRRPGRATTSISYLKSSASRQSS